jgi:hypothetical protein
MIPRIGQPVFLEAAFGLVGDGVFNKLLSNSSLIVRLKAPVLLFNPQYLSQFVC